MLDQAYGEWTPAFKRGLAHKLALYTLLRLKAERWIPDISAKEALLAIHREGRSFSLHDLLAYSLVCTLDARGEHHESTMRLRRYIEVYRVDRYPLPYFLAERATQDRA